MRQFLYGAVFGALFVYWYTFHGDQFFAAKRKIDSWRDQAVEDTSGYSAGQKR